MNKSDLITAVADKAGISKKDAEKAVSALLDTVVEKVASGDEIRIVGFGTFERRERKERTGSDPRTGKQIKIAASKVPALKPGKSFKEAVAGK